MILILMSAISAQILFSAVLLRHGIRAPKTLFPHNQDQWQQQQLTQLTPIGMSQMFNIGGYLRHYYSDTHNLIHPTYTPKQVQIISTDVTRTLISADCLKLGLFPPGTGPTIPKDSCQDQIPALPYRIQPIPIRSETKGNQKLLHGYKAQTNPQMEKIRKEMKQSSFFKEYQESIKPFLEKISSKLGYEVKGVKEASQLHGSIQCDLFNQKAFPVEISQEDYQILGEIHTWHQMNFPFSDQRALHYSCSAFFSRLGEQFQKSLKQSELKLALYVAHDHTQIAVLRCLGVQFPFIPTFGSSLRFEVNSNQTVSIFYNAAKQFSDQDLPVKIPKQDFPISLEKLLQVFSKYQQQMRYG